MRSILKTGVWIGLCASVGLWTCPARASLLNTELIANGDAETGDMTGWTTAPGGMETVASSVAGTVGLLLTDDIGDFCFTGALGDTVQSMTQSVDVSALAASIDAGLIDIHFSLLLQSRTVGGTPDLAFGTLTFLDAGDFSLGNVNFADNDHPVNVFDWEHFTHDGTLPAGTRSIHVLLQTSRPGGASNDGFFDNVSLILTPEPVAGLWLTLLGLPFAGRRSNTRR